MTDHDTPPDGGNAGKPMRAAISAALRREAEGDDGETAPTLALIVNKLISPRARRRHVRDQGDSRPHGRQDGGGSDRR